MKVEYTIKDEKGQDKKIQGDVIATIGGWYEALFVISLADGSFVKMPIEKCKKIA